ncbi:MAG: nitrilase-related carbon-nitrogen hydrolase, partial [Candidatus Xenobia bacterium]
MHVALAQLDMAWEDKAENYRRLEALLDTAQQPPDLIAMPEMFATGFSMEADRIAEPPDGETGAFLAALARKRHAFVVGTVVERGSHGGRNTCLVFGRDGKLLSRYAKIHPFSFAGEHKHYEKGTELPIVEVEGFRLATPICYDLRFPELFRHGTRRGATLFIVPANWPSKRVFHWRHLLVARAI